MLSPEQKNLALCMEHVDRYSQPGDKVVDLFASTCTTAVAYISLLIHRHFIGCDTDPNVVTAGRARVLNRFIANTAHGHIPSGIHVDDEMRNKNLFIYKRSKYGVADLPFATSTGVYVSPSFAEHTNLPLTQCLPTALLYYLAGVLQEQLYLAPETAAKGPDKWNPNLFGRFSTLYQRDIRKFLATTSSLYINETDHHTEDTIGDC